MFDSPGFRNSCGPLLSGTGPLSDSLRRLDSLLNGGRLPHIYVGRIATNAHGHARMTEDIDVCVRAADLLRCRDLLTDNGYVGAPGCARRFVDAQTDVTIDVLISGKVVGHRPEQQQITFPDPAEAEPHAGIPVPSLPRLIELKLGLWRFKDWGDVIELIRELELARSFAERLSPSLRPLYFDCYERRIEEDQYDPQIRDGAPQPYSEASAAGS